jgi:hypothetical protein
MHHDIARAYDCPKREHDRVRAACVKNLAQNEGTWRDCLN